MQNKKKKFYISEWLKDSLAFWMMHFFKAIVLYILLLWGWLNRTRTSFISDLITHTSILSWHRAPLLIKIHSVTGSPLPLTRATVSVIQYYMILFKSLLEFQWDSYWQLIARADDEHWLKTGSSLERGRPPTPSWSHLNFNIISGV